MSKTQCAFKNCNSSKHKYPNLPLFRIPFKDAERCKVWLERTGCPEKLSDFTPKQISLILVCALHFEQSSFNNYYCNSLVWSAIPVAGFINQDLLPMLDKNKTRAEVRQLLAQRDPKVKEQAKQKFISCNSEPIVTESAGSQAIDANNEQDPLDIFVGIPARKRNKRGGDDQNEVKCGVTVERGIVTKTDLVNALSEHLSGPPLTLFKMQILRSGDSDAKVEWAMEEKELALIMYYKSDRLYKYMRDRQHFMLPSDADIQHWIECTRHSSF